MVMKVDAGAIYFALDARLQIIPNDGDEMEEDMEYIENVLEKNHIDNYDMNDFGPSYVLHGDEIPKAMEAFGLEVDHGMGGDADHKVVLLKGNASMTATLAFTVADDNMCDMVEWLDGELG